MCSTYSLDQILDAIYRAIYINITTIVYTRNLLTYIVRYIYNI